MRLDVYVLPCGQQRLEVVHVQRRWHRHIQQASYAHCRYDRRKSKRQESWFIWRYHGSCIPPKDDVYLVKVFVPSNIAFLNTSPGKTNCTAVWMCIERHAFRPSCCMESLALFIIRSSTPSQSELITPTPQKLILISGCTLDRTLCIYLPNFIGFSIARGFPGQRIFMIKFKKKTNFWHTRCSDVLFIRDLILMALLSNNTII